MISITQRITICALLTLLITLSVGMKIAERKHVIIGYVTGYNGLIDVANIDAQKLTHINYAFVNVRNNQAHLEDYKRDSTNFIRLNSLKLKNPQLKILISIGGWSWSENFSNAVLTDSLRASFARNAVKIIRDHHLDGVDIDWEYPGMQGEDGNIFRPEDKANFTKMFEAIRKELDALEQETGQKKLLTTATGGFPDFLNHTEMGKAAIYLDYINLMTYDYYSAKVAGHHTNLYRSNVSSNQQSADGAITAYLAAGVPADKIVMGIAFYGRNLKLIPTASKGLGDTILSSLNSYGKGYTYLKDSLINQKGFKAYRDETAKAPYLFNSTTQEYISYDDEWSVAQKCNYVRQNKLGGVMFWEYNADRKGYLLNQIAKELK
ncbi:glycoside hydrolase family 18 protein [Pedobacter sandarakinus]|uniref:glycoside hydrolase family 18 protein n=1 Tax=Pedobacter sandarakinus TaxID=353156 RepID=UPI002246CDC5|nr:glycoside hydrolase family 18 protein [Pedobacter sandarakinus]MCX2574167.1 glycoside hydrolase family 18 protein [Pedobacter sandarakinus]